MIRIVKTSNLPTIIKNERNTLPTGGICAKLSIGPTLPMAGPTLPMHVAVEPIDDKKGVGSPSRMRVMTTVPKMKRIR